MTSWASEHIMAVCNLYRQNIRGNFDNFIRTDNYCATHYTFESAKALPVRNTEKEYRGWVWRRRRKEGRRRREDLHIWTGPPEHQYCHGFAADSNSSSQPSWTVVVSKGLYSRGQ